MLGVTGREFEITWIKLRERLGGLEWLRRSLKDAGKSGMGFWGSWWTLGGSFGVLGVTGRDFREPGEEMEKDQRPENRGWNEINYAGKRLGGDLVSPGGAGK